MRLVEFYEKDEQRKERLVYCEFCGSKFDREDEDIYAIELGWTGGTDNICHECYINFVREKISNTKGTFFGIEFLKDDGSVRKALVRTGVKRSVNGNGNGNGSDSYKRLYDIKKGGWITVRYWAVLKMTARKERFQFKDKEFIN